MRRNPLFYKISVIGLLALLLLLPLGMIESKIGERQMLQQQVQQDIARSASGPQTLTGPYLVIRYKLRETRTIKDEHGLERSVSEFVSHEAVVMPHTLKIDGNADVETRSRGIYQARLFNLHSTVSGDFVVPRGYGTDKPAADMIPQGAWFVMNVSDSRGIHNVPLLTLDGQKLEFSPGCIGSLPGNGMHVALQALQPEQSYSFHFEFPLELQGMSTLAMVPSGDTTEMSLKSSWPHPSFGGSFLPRVRNVDDKGFSAQWLVSNLARNGTASDVAGRQVAEVFTVDFINPVNVYLLSQRAVKYGVMFVVLVFTSFFMFEMMSRLRIHPLQYLLVGLAMAMFFLLIISLSEHIPFLYAYLASGAACVLLIGVYLAGMLKGWRPALFFSGGIALLYAVLYVVLQSEDNALLMGTLLMFVALAAVMLLTRHMDWYRLNREADCDAGYAEDVHA